MRLRVGARAVTVVVPFNTVAPAITGAASVGSTLTCSTGTWVNTPTGYSYQWKSGGVNVGTNANTYVPVIGDLGKTIACLVTATNASGSASFLSAAVGPVSNIHSLKFNVVANSQYVSLVAL